jgi:hypothetical protein
MVKPFTQQITFHEQMLLSQNSIMFCPSKSSPCCSELT